MGRSSSIRIKQKANICRPASVQPAIFKAPAGKGLENGSAPGEIDEATLRKGEVHYTTYFSQRGELPPTPQGLVAFH
jgi:pre-mRNA-processing factor 39